MPRPALHVEVTQAVQSESRDTIARGLIEFNVRQVGEYNWTSLDVYAREADGRIVGGLIGEFRLGWLSIHGLQKDCAVRGGGRRIFMQKRLYAASTPRRTNLISHRIDMLRSSKPRQFSSAHGSHTRKSPTHERLRDRPHLGAAGP